jgi:hypothetical protein
VELCALFIVGALLLLDFSEQIGANEAVDSVNG